MPEWLRQTLTFGIAAVITAALLGVMRRRSASAHRVALESGKPVTIEAFLRGEVAPYPRRWRNGWVTIGIGTATWRPRFSVMRRRLSLPASATIESIHRVAGIRETFSVSPDFVVIAVRDGQVNLELAVSERELITTMRALALGSGGGWQVPVGYLQAPEMTNQRPS